MNWRFFSRNCSKHIIGSDGIIKDTFTFGTLLSFNSLLAYFTGPLFRMINIQPSIQEASIAAERVSEILEMDIEQPDDRRLLEPSKLEGNIEFNHVVFKYGMRANVYNGLSLRIQKGQWAAFVGPSGCGKTTLVKLLLKFYEPDQGTVSIDGRDLRNVDAAALRARVGYVPQDIYIFAGTVAENITLRNPAAPMFVAEAKIKEPWLLSPGGEKVYLRAGISAMGRIIVDRDTVLRMALKKLDFINETFDSETLSEGKK